MSKHIETRRKLKSIVLKSDFEHLLDICIMTEEDKALMRMHYYDDKDFRFIADALGYSERNIKNRHLKILDAIDKVL